MAQAQTKGDKHILVMSNEELEVVRNGAILSAKVAAQGNEGGLNLSSLKTSIDVLEAVNPLFDAVFAEKKGKAAKA